ADFFTFVPLHSTPLRLALPLARPALPDLTDSSRSYFFCVFSVPWRCLRHCEQACGQPANNPVGKL
ncbi:MAG: hypothetical protein LBT53_06670, partial [Puniceicoccales bacterium]|nr:hypothetical protein [Puniceicoccales bacterium]